MTTTALKDARMELKTTLQAKDMLIKAATITGVDLTSFVLVSATERAQEVLRAHSSIILSEQGQEKLLQILTTESAPTQAMKDLMSLPDLEDFSK